MSDNYDKVSLLLPMNGANNGTEFTDWSPVKKTVTRQGALVTSTAQFQYYDSSGYWSASGQGLSGAGVDLLSGDKLFTVQFWFQRTSETSTVRLFGTGGGTTLGWNATSGLHVISTLTSGVPDIQVSNNTTSPIIINSDGSAIPLNTWTHYAATYDGTTIRLFIGGALVGSSTSTPQRPSTNPVWNIGNIPGEGWTSNSFFGYMQDFMFVTDAALYTAAFTPPTRLIGTISNAAVGATKILNAAGVAAQRTVFAVPRSAPVRAFSDVSNASGEFEIQAPAGVEHSVVALADETSLYNDIVARVIPE